MSTTSFELSAEVRTDIGKGASRRLRRLQDRVPAIVYGGHQEPTSLMLQQKDVVKALKDDAFYSHILTLSIAGKKEPVVLKSVQRHPYKPQIQHLDFQRIEAKEEITMHIPIHVKGEEVCPGVKEGGMVNRLFVDVEVRCLPADLPEEFVIDISESPLDTVIHLSDLKVSSKVELLALSHGQDQPVLSIHKPKRVEETEEVAPAADTAPSGSPSAEAKSEQKSPKPKGDK